MSKPLSLAFPLGSLATAVSLVSGAVHASNLTVTNLNDSGPGSLREAMEYAVNDGGAASVIRFQEGLRGALRLNSPLPVISDSLTLYGSGITLQGGFVDDAMFRINLDYAHTVNLRGFTIVPNQASVVEAQMDYTYVGVLALDSLVVSGGQARLLDVEAGTGQFRITNSEFRGNHSDTNGTVARIQQGTLIVRDSHFIDNESDASGAALLVDGSRVQIERSVLSGNLARHFGGALSLYNASEVLIQDSTFADNVASYGGAIFAAVQNGGDEIRIDRTTLKNNEARENLGGFGGGGDGGALFVTGYDTSNVAVVITDSIITGNRAEDDGGALVVEANNFYMARSLVSDNEAGDDDGAMEVEATSLTLLRSVISGNRAENQAIGDLELAGYNGTLSLIDTTLSGNVSETSVLTLGVPGNDGNAIQVIRSTFSGNRSMDSVLVFYTNTPEGSDSLLIANSTFSGNRTTAAQSAIRVTNLDAEIQDSTFVNNQATLPSGSEGSSAQLSIHAIGTGREVNAAISRSVMTSGNANEVFAGGPVIGQGVGAFPVGDVSVSMPDVIARNSVGLGINAELVGASPSAVDPQLAPLGYRGGYTLVHEPLAGSPAIDAVAGARYGNEDQRLLFGLVGANSDLGAVEVTTNTPPVRVANIGKGLSGKAGTPIADYDLSLAFEDDNGEVVVESVEGLPPGLVLSEGTVSGTPTTPGQWHVTVTVRDFGDLGGPTLRTVEQGVVTIRGQGSGGGGGGGAVPVGVLALFGFLALLRRRHH